MFLAQGGTSHSLYFREILSLKFRFYSSTYFASEKVKNGGIK